MIMRTIAPIVMIMITRKTTHGEGNSNCKGNSNNKRCTNIKENTKKNENPTNRAVANASSR